MFTFGCADIAHARQSMQASLLSLKRNIDFIESTSVNYVFLCHDSAKRASTMALAAPSVRQNKEKLRFLWFCARLSVPL
jgi:hypothetical protein